MSHPLENKIQAIYHRVRWLKFLYALGWIVGILLLAVVALAGLDFLFRYQDPGLRILSSCTLLIVVSGTFYYFVRSAIRNKLTKIDVAQRIEHCFPDLQGKLSSTIAFLQQDEDDEYAGSAELRRNVVNQTAAIASDMNFSQAIQSRPIKKLSLVMALILILVGSLFFTHPATAVLAMTRLFLPISDHPWPQVHRLVLKEKVTRIAQGQTFEIAVTDDSGTLPEKTLIHYRYHANHETNMVVEQELMRVVGDQAIARKENAVQEFQYRVTGGDDETMPWISVQVVQPPQIKTLAVTVVPPVYTGWKVTEVEQSFEALVNSQILVTGRTSKPLKQATLMLESGNTIQATLATDRQGFTIASLPEKIWKLDHSRSYWFELTDADGVTVSSTRWEIRPLTDSAPNVVIEEPTGTVYATTKAKFDLLAIVRDDLAISEINLEYKLIKDGKPFSESVELLYRGPSQPPTSQRDQSGRSAARISLMKNDRQEIQHTWDLNQLALQPGTSIQYSIVASDYQPAVAQSPTMQIMIVSQQQFENRLASQYRLILNQLNSVLKLQRSVQSKCFESQTQLSKSQSPAKKISDQLQAAEVNQRQVTRMLSGDSESALNQLKRLKNQLQINHVVSSELAKRIDQLQAELALLAENHLPQTEHALITVSKMVQLHQKSANNDQFVLKNLNQAISHQEQIIQTLADLLGELIQWDSFHQLKRDLADVHSQQQRLLKHTTKAGQETFGKHLRDLTEQQKAFLKNLSNRQGNLSQQISKINKRMKSLIDQGSQDLTAKNTLKKVIDFSQSKAVQPRMQQAANHLEQNRIGQSRQIQSQVSDDIQQLVALLSRRDPAKTDKELNQLKQQAIKLDNLLQAQKQLRRDLEELQKKSSQEKQQLLKQQKALRKQAQDLAKQLRKQNVHKPARTVARAGETMKRIASMLENNDFSEVDADQVEQDLQDALRQLRRHTQQQQMAKKFQENAKLLKAVQKLIKAQKEIIRQTSDIEKNKKQFGRRTLLAKIQETIGLQQQLITQTQKMANDYAKLQVVALTLNTAMQKMTDAAEQLSQQNTALETLQTMQEAVGYLQQIIKSYQTRKSDLSQPEDNENQDQKSNNNQQRKNLSDLRLLKLLQLDLLEKTKRLEEAKQSSGMLSKAQQYEYQQLADLQGQLVELLGKFFERKE